MSNNSEITGWVGWPGFASFLLLFSGFFHIIEGVAYLARQTVFVHASGYVWVLDYNKWGWINVVGGALVVIAALVLIKGGLWGRVFSSLVVIVSMLIAVTSIPFFPVWSLVVLVADALILFAITVHGTEVKKS